MVTSDQLDGAIRELIEAVNGKVFGSVTVQQVMASIDRDSEDDVALFLALQLSDPVGDTWPTEDVLTLRRAVLEVAQRLELDVPLYLRLTPATDLPQQEEDGELDFGT